MKIIKLLVPMFLVVVACIFAYKILPTLLFVAFCIALNFVCGIIGSLILARKNGARLTFDDIRFSSEPVFSVICASVIFGLLILLISYLKGEEDGRRKYSWW